MAESMQAGARGGIDPLRPSARRVALLVAGGVGCVLMFVLGLWVGMLPYTIRSARSRVLVERAMRGDQSLDFASPEWVQGNAVANPQMELALDFPPEAIPAMAVMALILAMLVVVVHILIVRAGALLALRADRRLDLGLGSRPVKAVAAMVIVRILLARVLPLSFACGVLGGLFLLGTAQDWELSQIGLSWLPYAGLCACLALVPLLDVWFAVRAVRKRLQEISPVDSRICNGCGYSLRGLPASVEACPECGRTLLANRTVVSLLLGRRAGLAAMIALGVLLAIGFGGVAMLIVNSPTGPGLAADWLLARPSGGAWPSSAILPNGAVVRISDGATEAYVGVHSSGQRSGGEITRLRAIEPDPIKGPTRVEHMLRMTPWSNTGLIAGPAPVHAAYPFGPSASLLLVSGTTAGKLSIRIVGRESIPATEVDWLTAPFDPDDKDDESGE